MRVPRMVTLAVGANALSLLVACSGTGQPVGGGGGGEHAAAPTTIDVTLTEFAIEPAAIEAASGAPIAFSITNAGSAPHTFGVTAAGRTYETPTIDAGGTATLDVPSLEAGSYEILCTVPGHDQLGMKGTLTLAGAAGGGTATSDQPGSMDDMQHSNMTAEEMATAHKAGVDAFLAGDQTKGHGNRPLEPTIVDGVKVFELDVTHAFWEVEKGVVKKALAYNGQIPGPELRAEPGDRVRIVLTNHTDQPTVLHFHGLTLPNAMDGVPYVTQEPVMPGESFEYAFRIADPPGMYVYHSHFNSAEQVGSGLYGAFIVEPPSGGGATLTAKSRRRSTRCSSGTVRSASC